MMKRSLTTIIFTFMVLPIMSQYLQHHDLSYYTTGLDFMIEKMKGPIKTCTWNDGKSGDDKFNVHWDRQGRITSSNYVDKVHLTEAPLQLLFDYEDDGTLLSAHHPGADTVRHRHYLNVRFYPVYEDGSLRELHQYYSHGGYTIHKFSYDDDNRSHTVTRISAEGERWNVFKTRFDPLGRPKKQGGKPATVYRYRWDNKNRLTKYVVRCCAGKDKWKYKWNDNTDIKTTIHKGTPGKKKWEDSPEDRNGRYKYYYLYDKYGNWNECIIVWRGKQFKRIVRKIEYYE